PLSRPAVSCEDAAPNAIYTLSLHDALPIFKIAGSMGFKEGFHKASPVLLEPIMKVEIVTPEDYLGDVMGDVSRRRGVLQGQDDRDRKSTRLNSSHVKISYAVFCLKKKTKPA